MKMFCCSREPPRPLYFFGNEMPAKPPLNFLVIHLRARHDRWIAMD